MAGNYFFFFVVFGLIMPYLSPVLLEMGYSKQQIGWIWGLLYLFNTVNPLLGGRIADRFLSTDRMLGLCALAMMVLAALLWWLSYAPSTAFLLALLAFQAVRSPIIPLQDTLAMQVAGNDPRSFSRQRLVGSLGFVVAVVGFAYLSESAGRMVFFPVVFATVLFFLVSTHFVPVERKQAAHKEKSRGFWGGLSLGWWMWLLAMMCHWFCYGPYNYGFTLFLEESGVGSRFAGWFWTIGVAAEIFVFSISGWFFARWRIQTLLLAAFGANLLRWLVMGLWPQPWIIGFSQLLHGLGFALFYAAALAGIGAYCAGTNRASYQGLFSTCVGGLSSVLGAVCAGWLHHQLPFREVLLLFLPVQLVGMVLLWRFPLQPAAEATPQGEHPEC